MQFEPGLSNWYSWYIHLDMTIDFPDRPLPNFDNPLRGHIFKHDLIFFISFMVIKIWSFCLNCW